MTVSIAWSQNSDGNWDISFSNGQITTEDTLNSIVKHIVFCNGEINSALQLIRNRRGGFIGDILNSIKSFSAAWFYYVQNSNTNESRQQIKNAITTALLSHPYIQNLQSQGNQINVSTALLRDNGVAIAISIGRQQINLTT